MINVCKICGLEYASKRKLSRHVNKAHKLTMKNYYDQFYKQDGEGYCKVCGKPTKFGGFRYKKTCSQKCMLILRDNPNLTPANPIPKVLKHLEPKVQLNVLTNVPKKVSAKVQNNVLTKKSKKEDINITVNSVSAPLKLNIVTNTNSYSNIHKTTSEYIKPTKYSSLGKHLPINTINKNNDSKVTFNPNIYGFKLDTYEKLNDCIRIGKVVEKFGQEWFTIKKKLKVFKGATGFTYVKAYEIPKIVEFCRNYTSSEQEKELYQLIKSNYSGIIKRHSKGIIRPYLLDIYLPELKIAIEFNNHLYDSIEYGCAKDLHLQKSILCKEQGIRLIQIYDFEDLSKQSQLILDLINGKDHFIKYDFNKNNLIETVPLPTLIKTINNKYHIYGAGNLY